MSFILDALKKSETERQQQSGAEFSNLPSSSGDPQSFKWVWILALLLLVNIAVLVGVLMRPNTSVQEAQEPESAAVESAEVSSGTFEEKIAAAKEKQAPTPEFVEPESQAVPVAARPAVAKNRPRILTIDEVRVNGSLQITDLHLDIHVYSTVPAERFVFINMTKHREQSQLEEGPRVLEITPDGVVLEHQGVTFLLPRE